MRVKNGTSQVYNIARPSHAQRETVSQPKSLKKPACLSFDGKAKPGYVRRGLGSAGRRSPSADMGETGSRSPGKSETIYADRATQHCASAIFFRRRRSYLHCTFEAPV